MVKEEFIELRELEAAMHQIKPCDEKWEFYYDETGNCRKFRLKEGGDFNNHDALSRYLINGQRQFLILVVLVIVTARQVGEALGGNDLAHQFDGRVVLTAVTAALGLDVDIADALRAVEPLGGVGINIRIQLCLDRQTQQEHDKGNCGINPALHQPRSRPSHGWRSSASRTADRGYSQPPHQQCSHAWETSGRS